ncbi:hypothetical protein GR925_07590 [Streptomyces sp. HUCO-GS316]|uniref:DNA recombination protein RmuC n=1 Tax=Streptomyces sp. HUCO-GS316 TaxID=2692198 RepID=UPI00136948A6|nr:DNA recombination protein RmuC [Streptomyces sp. HUCO-GS316]MXM63312.1 hypothetical protein [Streptomyces sp. HUCO-GS316]
MSWLNVKHAMDLSPWIRIPLMWPEPGLEDVEEAQTPEAWARYFAEGLWEDFASEKPEPGEVDLLTNILLMYAIRAPAAFPDFEVFLHLPHPREIPLPAYVDLVEIEEGEDRETALRELTHTDASYTVEPPPSSRTSTPRIWEPACGYCATTRTKTATRCTSASAMPGATRRARKPRTS